MDSTEIVNFSICIFIIILHLFCLYALFISKNDNSNYARCFLINISTFDITLCLCHMLYFFIGSLVPNPVVYTWTRALVSGIAFPQYGCILLITINRSLEVYWNMKFYQSAFYKHRRVICFLPWFLWLLWLVTVPVLNVKFNIDLETIIDFSNTILDVIGHAIVLVTFSIVYTYLYTKFRKMKAGHRKKSIFHVNAFLPFFIVLTFFLFQTVPLLLYLLSIKKAIMMVFILNRFDALSNAIFYIALNPSIRRNIQQLAIFKHRRDNTYFVQSTKRMLEISSI
jgi:hypothetical protein